MNKKIKKKWVKALRSKKYKQGYQVLRRKNRFCCLGVLCDIAAKEGVGEWRGKKGYHFKPSSQEIVATAILPEAVVEWAGLSHADPEVPILDGVGVAMSELNDNEGYSFKKIAKLIEKHL